MGAYFFGWMYFIVFQGTTCIPLIREQITFYKVHVFLPWYQHMFQVMSLLSSAFAAVFFIINHF